MNSFNAQFPPLEWLDNGTNGKVLHLHSVAVQTQAADIAAAAETAVEVFFVFLIFLKGKKMKSIINFTMRMTFNHTLIE